MDIPLKNKVLELTGKGLSEFLNDALEKFGEDQIDKSEESPQMIHLKRRLGKINTKLDKQLKIRTQINAMLPLDERERDNIVSEIRSLKIKEGSDKE